MKLRVLAAAAVLFAASAHAAPTTSAPIGSITVNSTNYSVSLLYDDGKRSIDLRLL